MSTSFRERPFSVEISPLRLKDMYSVLFALTWRPMPSAAGGYICQKCYVIGVVRFLDCLCEVSSASFLCQLEGIVVHFIDRYSKYVV